MTRLNKIALKFLLLAMLLTINILLGQSSAQAACDLNGGYGGIWDGPWETTVPCSGCGGCYCLEAECGCGTGSDFFDSHCLDNHLCAGQCGR